MKQGELTADERRWAMFAHGSIVLLFIFFVGGVITSFLIWQFKKKQSEYVAFQAKQALFFQLFALLILLILIPLIIFVYPLALGYGLYAAYRCYHGRDFKYPVIGKFLTPRGV